MNGETVNREIINENSEIYYRMEKVSEIVADHVSRGNKGLRRLNIIEKRLQF